MPLAKGSSEATISANIAEMIRSGHDPKQAEAAAYRMARRDSIDITRAAGIMFLTPKNEVLFLKRGPLGDHPGEWCFPGGTVEGDETPTQTAEREAIEELGSLPKGARSVWTRSVANNEIAAPLAPDAGLPPTDALVVPGVQTDYTTFLQRIPETFEPTLNPEHTGYAWATADAPPEPLHPGCRIALGRLKMNELDVARAMAAGELTSPQRYHNVWLFDIRITGTGQAFRSAKKDPKTGKIEREAEHVWRDPAHYLTDDFLARCNGLTVVWVHPEKSMLNSKEFNDRVIGACFLNYFKRDDVWSIVKIYDDEAAADMALQDLSTSPGVILGGGDDVRVKLEDGSNLLIEGDPILVDHIAIVPNGVWDKGGDPSGIRTDSIRNDAMAEETEAEKKAREAEEARDRRDAMIMDAVTSLAKRFDASEEAREKEKAREDAARRDAARADAMKRRDEERKEWEKEDAAFCAQQDAQERTECDAAVKDGADPDEAADKARKDRRDRHDARRKDAQAEKDRKDAEKREADAARHDSAETIAKAVQDALRANQRTETDSAAIADAQARADAVESAFGRRARAPMIGETPADYELAQARALQKHSPRWKEINLGLLTADARGIAVADIYNDAVVASRSPENFPEDELVYRHRVDQVTGHRITEAFGRGTFIREMKQPTMRVTEISRGKGN